MQRRNKAPSSEVTVVQDGVDSFPENKEVIEFVRNRGPLPVSKLLESFNDLYHGFDKPGCILVKKRREMVGNTPNQHYLDIYACLTCGLNRECLRSGWEIGYWNGTPSATASSKVVSIPVDVYCKECGKHEHTTANKLNRSFVNIWNDHLDGDECKEKVGKFYKHIAWDFSQNEHQNSSSGQMAG